ncbi:MAG: sugar ABC transporter ATP-binding protein [Pirellulales bacterium]|nr:sugar ABC transporter ATP-binding protein [Pirellulales bacterium]
MPQWGGAQFHRGEAALLTTAPVISFQQVTKRFPGVIALQTVSIDVAPGELHAVVGENGAGKSTLMKCLCGVITDYEGTLRVRGKPVRFRGTTDAERDGIGIIHQELNLVEGLSAAANIFLGREKTNRLGLLNDRAMAAAAGKLLTQLECDVRPGEPVRELRVGDQQLVEIAKAELYRLMDKLCPEGLGILVTSSELPELLTLCDRILVLCEGHTTGELRREEATEQRIMELATQRPGV